MSSALYIPWFLFIIWSANLTASVAFSSYRSYSKPTFAMRWYINIHPHSKRRVNLPFSDFHRALHAESSPEPHPPQTYPKSTDFMLLSGDDIQEDDTTPFFTQIYSSTDDTTTKVVRENNSSSVYHGDSNLNLTLLKKGCDWVTDILFPIFDRNVKKGVPVETLKGAALVGIGLSTFVGKSLVACGMMSVGAVYMAITPGKAGDLLRAVGSATWNSTEYAMHLYNKYNVPRSIQRVAHHFLLDIDKHVNTTLVQEMKNDEQSTVVHTAGEMSKELEEMLKNNIIKTHIPETLNAEENNSTQEEHYMLDDNLSKKFQVYDSGSDFFTDDSSKGRILNDTAIQGDETDVSDSSHNIETRESTDTESVAKVYDSELFTDDSSKGRILNDTAIQGDETDVSDSSRNIETQESMDTESVAKVYDSELFTDDSSKGRILNDTAIQGDEAVISDNSRNIETRESTDTDSVAKVYDSEPFTDDSSTGRILNGTAIQGDETEVSDNSRSIESRQSTDTDSVAKVFDSEPFTDDSSTGRILNDTAIQGDESAVSDNSRSIETRESTDTESVASADKTLPDSVDTNSISSIFSESTSFYESSSSLLSDTGATIISSINSGISIQERIIPTILPNSPETESFEMSIKLKKKGKRTTEDSKRKLQQTSKENVSKIPVEPSKKSKKGTKSRIDSSVGTDVTSSIGRDIPDDASLTVPELKEKLRKLGLKVTGVKAELLNRLHEYEERSDR